MATTTTTEQDPATRFEQRPTLSLASVIATSGYVGYIPVAPGTWGSLVGCLIYWAFIRNSSPLEPIPRYSHGVPLWQTVPLIYWLLITAIFITGFGLLAAHTVAIECGKPDPQFVVIDEVSGQLLTYIVALVPANWKYLLLGFILFRGFDIWKPFPARRAEKLPGGWGIMADDWVAGIYAGIILAFVRILGF
jgi:phosphatidylglycerophosphatase A